jgi:hypothetical protein
MNNTGSPPVKLIITHPNGQKERFYRTAVIDGTHIGLPTGPVTVGVIVSAKKSTRFRSPDAATHKLPNAKFISIGPPAQWDDMLFHG